MYLLSICGLLAISAHCSAESGKAVAVETTAQPPGWSVGRSARLLVRSHVSRPDIADIPTDPDAFLRYLTHLDPHAALIDLNEERSVSDSGLGVLLLSNAEEQLIVPLKNGPAWLSGLHQPVLLDVASQLTNNRIQGQFMSSGRQVDTTVVPGQSKHGIVEELNIGAYRSYRVTDFRSRLTTADGMRKFDRHDSAGIKNKSLQEPSRKPDVLDLRYCGGGDVYEATDFASLWLEESRQWISLNQGQQESIALSAVPESHRHFDMPELILVSRYTASACEQLVMGLMEYTDVSVIGETTYGKCTLQTTFPVGRGYRLKFTTGEWAGPGGKPCDSDGITPTGFLGDLIHDDAAVAAYLDDIAELKGR